MSRTANGTSHAYTFAYDGLNRLTDAVHSAGRYTEKVTAYDKNGNIKSPATLRADLRFRLRPD